MRKVMSWIYDMFRPCPHEYEHQATLTDGEEPVVVEMCAKCWRVRFTSHAPKSTDRSRKRT